MARQSGWKQLRAGWTILLGLALATACSGEAPVIASAPAATVELPKAAPVGATPPVHRASSSRFEVQAVLELDRPLKHGDYAWNAEGVPPGPTLIVVDIGSELIHVFRGGYEIGRATVLYGADDKPTPIGTFPILEKDRDHVSNLYDAPMPYMLRLTWDGVAIHGSSVDYGYATHGCVGVPDEFAQELFAIANKGDKVIVTRGLENVTTA